MARRNATSKSVLKSCVDVLRIESTPLASFNEEEDEEVDSVVATDVISKTEVLWWEDDTSKIGNDDTVFVPFQFSMSKTDACICDLLPVIGP
jgi:hypothetical protein